jgi:predicted MFS family arabinose efflux permease
MAGYSFALAFAITGMFYLLTLLLVLIKIQDIPPTPEGEAEIRAKVSFKDMLISLKEARFAKICFLVFLIAFVSAQLITGFSLHGIKYMGFAQYQIGWLFALDGLVVVLLQYHAAKIMNRHKLTTSLVAGSVLYGLGYIILGRAQSFVTAVVAIVLSSIGQTAVSPGQNSLIANIAPGKNRGRFLGMQAMAIQAGAGLGMVSAGVFMEYLSPVSPALPWLIIGLICFLTALGFYRMRNDFTDEENGIVKS